jgi:hypothetical protein
MTIKFTRLRDSPSYCEHLMPIIEVFRENQKVNGNARIITKYDDCPILQCKICRIEVLATEPWLQFFFYEEQEESRRVLGELDK